MTDIEQHIAMELDDENAQKLSIPPEIMEIIKKTRLDLSKFDGLTDDEL